MDKNNPNNAFQRMSALLDAIRHNSGAPLRAKAEMCLEIAQIAFEKGRYQDAYVRADRGLLYIVGRTSLEMVMRDDCLELLDEVRRGLNRDMTAGEELIAADAWEENRDHPYEMQMHKLVGELVRRFNMTNLIRERRSDLKGEGKQQ